MSQILSTDFNEIIPIILPLCLLLIVIFWIVVSFVKYKSKELEQQLNLKVEQLSILNENLMEEIKMRKEAEKKLIEYTEELKEINIAKDKFYSIISHDLKSPFQGLLSYAEMLYDEYDSLSDDIKKEIVKGIRNSSKNIYSLLINLLEWSRLQTNKIKVELVKINLKNKVDEILNLHSANAARKNISLKNEVDNNAIIYADDYMLSSVLHNLVSNAVKFTKDNGKVYVKSEFSQNGVEISVHDTGIGIAAENLQQLFKIGTHYTTKGTYSENGTGLGLLLCKEMVEKHGGNISVESKLNEGSIFKIFIPNKIKADEP